MKSRVFNEAGEIIPEISLFPVNGNEDVVEKRFEFSNEMKSMTNLTFQMEDAVFQYSEIDSKKDFFYRFNIEGEVVCLYFILEGSLTNSSVNTLQTYESKTNTHNIFFWKSREVNTYYKKNQHIKLVNVFLNKNFFLKCIGKDNNILDDGFSKLSEGERWLFKEDGEIINDEMLKVISEIIETKRKGIFLKLFLESKLYELLMLQLESLKQQEHIEEKVDPTKKLAQSIHKIIKQNTFAEFTLRDIAKKLGSNISTVSNSFKQHYHITIFQYWNNLRFNEAKKMLLNNYSVKEIAIIMGYKNPNHFSTAFKKHFSITPTEYLNSKFEQ